MPPLPSSEQKLTISCRSEPPIITPISMMDNTRQNKTNQSKTQQTKKERQTQTGHKQDTMRRIVHTDKVKKEYTLRIMILINNCNHTHIPVGLQGLLFRTNPPFFCVEESNALRYVVKLGRKQFASLLCTTV